MTLSDKQEATIPLARREFAQRLRELRVPRGFRTARSLARTLEIDENRYTRYERAEVEPDLAMIRRICEALGVTPNDLLGMPSAAETERGSKDRLPSASHGNGAASQNESSAILGLPMAAWALAEAAVTLRGRFQATAGAVGSPPMRQGAASLAHVAQTGAVYKALMEQPFEAITSLLSEPAIAQADPGHAASFKERIDRLFQLLHHH